VPPGVDDDLRGVRLAPRRGGRAVEVVDAIALELRFGVVAVLERVVDDQQIDVATGEPGTDRGGLEPSAGGGVPLLDRGRIARELDARRECDAARFTRLRIAEFESVGDVPDEVRRVRDQIPRDEVEEEIGLPVPGRDRDADVEALAPDDPVEQVDELLEVRRRDVAGGDAGDEVEKGLVLEAVLFDRSCRSAHVRQD
jgi:hypothetical protein